MRKSFWPLPPVLLLEALAEFAPPIELDPPIPNLLESRLACLKRLATVPPILSDLLLETDVWSTAGSTVTVSLKSSGKLEW